jgi:hypothetical protein
MSYYNKYLKYKNKYLKLKNYVGGSLDTNLINPIKPLKISSVKTQNQDLFSTCWAHSISRMFIRTFQILDIIKAPYINQYYELFYTILLKKKSCDDFGNFKDVLYLFNYLKNHSKQLFSIKKKNTKCINNKCLSSNDQPILQLNLVDQQNFINDLKYLFDNKLIFLARYIYDLDINGKNKPTKAIKTMLDYRLQPCVSINISEYLDNFINENIAKKKNEYNLLRPINNNNIVLKTKNNCVDSESGHTVNLRRWLSDRIEFKNSWGEYGNFAVTDLKYLTCNNTDNIIEFECLLFDYDNLNKTFRDNVDNQLKLYHSTFDPSIEIQENTNYKCSYDKYGFLDGKNCELKFNDGRIYNGTLKNGLENGNGQQIFKSGSMYIGEWINGAFDGQCILTYLDGQKYNGEWKDDNRNGRGVEIYTNGEKYDGEWVDDKRNGRGIVTYSNGIKYDGEWKDDKRNGRGISTYSNGEKYDGEWKDDKRNGKGVLTHLGRIKYDGDWENNKRNGKGMEIYNNVGTYIGEWIDDKRNGKGILTCLDGRKYNGEWVDDKRNGKGKEIGPNGQEYNGKWVNDKANGRGILTVPNGERYDGEWKNDKRNGKGTQKYSNGTIYTGEWKDDNRI